MAASVVLQVTSNLNHSEQSDISDERSFEEKVCEKLVITVGYLSLIALGQATITALQ